MASIPDGVEVHVLPAGSPARSMSVRYRRVADPVGRIAAATRATSRYLDTRLDATA
jgi:hypothetical protein